MNCQKCNCEIPSDSLFCPYCGYKVESLHDPSCYKESPVTGLQNTKKKKGPKGAFIISLLILCIVFCGIYYVAYSRARAHALVGNFTHANKLLFARSITALHDPLLLEYEDAGLLALSGDYSGASKIYERLSEKGYYDSDKRVLWCHNNEANRSASNDKMLDSVNPIVGEVYSVGDIVIFGEYEQDGSDKDGKEPIEWIVLDKDGMKLLLLSRYVLDQLFYDSGYDGIWESCSLRRELNDSFYKTAFNTEEQAAVINTNLENEALVDIYEDYKTYGGNNTNDNVFLLSIEEVDQYFKTEKDLKCEPTEYAKSKGLLLGNDNCCYWYLRSPGSIPYYTSAVNVFGQIKDMVELNSGKYGIRPAIWIDLYTFPVIMK